MFSNSCQYLLNFTQILKLMSLSAVWAKSWEGGRGGGGWRWDADSSTVKYEMDLLKNWKKNYLLLSDKRLLLLLSDNSSAMWRNEKLCPNLGVAILSCLRHVGYRVDLIHCEVYRCNKHGCREIPLYHTPSYSRWRRPSVKLHKIWEVHHHHYNCYYYNYY